MDTKESGLTHEDVSTKQQRIADNAKKLPGVSFCSLAHHMDVAWLAEAYNRTRKDGAVGIDGQTAVRYAQGLDENLKDLLERAKSGRYRAPAVRRVHIPKPGSKETRPIGIPTFEDKVLQRAVVMLLEPIYETDFYGISFGFRPGKSQHQALRYLREGIFKNSGGWAIDLDIRKFFDTLDHAKLREIVAKRVRDGVVRKLIDKWLKAGVMEKGELTRTDRGTPQGGVISPLLSNIYLHEVLDAWFVQDVRPRMKGRSFIVRFADDAVMGFSVKEDAERVMAVLPKRFVKYGLTVHPEKTRLLDIRKPVTESGRADDGTKPGTFAFLGFTHYWGVSRKGNWAVMQKTETKRLSRAIQNLTKWQKEHRHDPINHQHEAISLKLKGHYAYYGITGNSRSLGKFLYVVTRNWFKWLNRRSRNRHLVWDKFAKYLKQRPLPPPRIVHSVFA
jgi:group II intron reverse transcriptase/maturase